MSVAETTLVYAGIPLALILVVALLTVFRGSGKPPRYKPGSSWDYEDVWYEPHHEPGAHGSGHAGELITGHGQAVHDGTHGDGSGHGQGHGSALGAVEHPGALAAALAIGETPHEAQPGTGHPAGPAPARSGGATAISAAGAAGLPRRTAAGGARGTW